MFWRLVRLGSFPACWRQASVTPILNDPPSSSVANCRPISITSVCQRRLSVWCLLVLNDLWKTIVCFQPPSLLIGKVWVPMIYICVSHTLKSAWRVGRNQINFSAAFDRVNHQGILYRLCSVGIGGSVLSILTQFLSNWSQHVMVDNCRSKLVDVVSGVPQGSILGQLLFLLYTLELSSILENKLIR